MKKKLLPFILGCSMLAALPLTAHAADEPEQNSGNVEYGSFADVDTNDSGTTDVITAIPQCTLTIPRDTTIKRGARTANIGRVTVNGEYFVKPYYVEVSAARDNFTLVENGEAKGANALAKEDIIFDVATTRNAAGTTQAADDEPDTTSATAASQATFVKSGTLSYNATSKKTTFEDGETRACRRFWKDETIATAANQDKDYRAGEVSNIKGQENVWLRVGTPQWQGVENHEDDTKPVGGQYKGSITFTATFRDDFDDTYTGDTPNMTTWAAYPRA